MSLLASIDAWTSDYLRSREAALAALQGALGRPTSVRNRQIASVQQNIDAVERHREEMVEFGLKAKGK